MIKMRKTARLAKCLGNIIMYNVDIYFLNGEQLHYEALDYSTYKNAIYITTMDGRDIIVPYFNIRNIEAYRPDN